MLCPIAVDVFCRALASEITEKPFHAGAAYFSLGIGTPLLTNCFEAAFLVGILCRRIANEDADLGEAKPLPSALFKDLIEQYVYQSPSAELW